jgi:hypothetical protein
MLQEREEKESVVASRLSIMKLVILFCLCGALLTRTRSVELEVSPDGTTVPAPPLQSLESLTIKNPTYLDIMEHQHIVAAAGRGERHVSGPSLAFVTPWNSRGYTVSLTFREKLTYISPVWLQLRKEGGGGGLVVTGQHDIDKEWVQKLRSDCVHCPKVGSRLLPYPKYSIYKASTVTGDSHSKTTLHYMDGWMACR